MQLVFLINLMCLSQFRNFSERLVLAWHSSELVRVLGVVRVLEVVRRVVGVIRVVELF